jgi:hypothetical protein
VAFAKQARGHTAQREFVPREATGSDTPLGLYCAMSEIAGKTVAAGARCWPNTTSASDNELRRSGLQLRLHGLSISLFMTIQWPGMVNNRR